MEKIKESYHKKYPILRIFKQDIKEIAELFKENFENIIIIADSYKLNDISEIDNIKKKEITDIEFKISTKNSFISLDLSKRSATIYSSDDDDLNTLGIISKIDSILSKRINKKLNLLVSDGMHLSLVLILLSLFFYNNLIKNNNLESNNLLTKIIIIYFIFYTTWAIWSYKVKSKKYSLIYLYDSSAPGFFERNKDNIILMIISALFGGIITILIQELFK